MAHGFSVGYFNSRPREGGDVIEIMAVLDGAISIHAPAKGATSAASAITAGGTISIHAPAKGATD